jgi:hypothetical protein
MSVAAPRLDVVIVNWSTGPYLRECLDAVAAAARFAFGLGQVVVDNQLRELFPYLPTQSALHKRRAALRDTFDWLCAVFAARSLGAHDPVVLIARHP